MVLGVPRCFKWVRRKKHKSRLPTAGSGQEPSEKKDLRLSLYRPSGWAKRESLIHLKQQEPFRQTYANLLISAQIHPPLTSCFIEVGFVWGLRSKPEPASPQADAVELTAKSRIYQKDRHCQVKEGQVKEAFPKTSSKRLSRKPHHSGQVCRDLIGFQANSSSP